MIIEGLIAAFEKYADKLPLELFVFVGSFLEEAISPIPSFVVLIPGGAAAQVQGFSWWYLPILAVVGAAGRILASMLLYLLADKGEDLLLGKGRRFFGISHEQLERYGERLSGKSRDWWALFALNAIPVLPTSLLSLACGFIKVRFSLFVSATFVGTAVNGCFYLTVGYAGLQAASALQHLELAFQLITIAACIGLLIWLLYYRKQRRRGKKDPLG